MGDMLSPGVYVNESDLSDYVSEMSTCVIGMVGGARRGPVGIPTLLTTQEQAIGIFGEPVEGEYGMYSVLAALTHASQVYYTRVVRSGIKASAGVVGTDKVLYYAKNTGEDSNGYIIEQSAELEGIFNIVIKNPEGEVVESYDGVSLKNSDDRYVEAVVNSASTIVQVDVQYTGTIKDSTFTLSGGAGSGKYAKAGVKGQDKITFQSKTFDSDLNGCTIVMSTPDTFGYFDISINDGDTVIESWDSLVLDEDSDRFAEYVINRSSNRVICSVDTNDSIKYEEKTLAFTGGDDGIDGITADDIIGGSTGGGIMSFSNPEAVNVDVITTPGWSDDKVIRECLSMCESRGDCIYIIDAPFGLSAQEVMSWSNGTGSYTHKGYDSSYGALYWPWLKVADTFTKKDIWLPPSGFVAAQYAYNDSVGYPWTAPAGLDRGVLSKPIGLELSPTKGERDAVYGNRNIVNPIINLLTNGIVIWGQKTTQRKPSALDRVNVRRLMNYIKKTINESLRYFVFEQNDSSTWERLVLTIEPKLSSIKTARGIYDYKMSISPDESDIENNRMPIKVYVKPTKTAEFIPIGFNVMPYNASFDN